MQDARLALRNLARRPMFSAVAILTLALGIGANTAVFTVSNAVLLAPLPYDKPDEVVILNEQTPQFASLSVTRYNYHDWRTRAKSFSGMAAFRPTSMTVRSSSELPRSSRATCQRAGRRGSRLSRGSGGERVPEVP